MKNILYFIAILMLCLACKKEQSKKDTTDIAAIESGLFKGMILKGDSIKTYTIQDRMQELHVPGVSIAVIKDGKIDWAKGYGIANSISGIPVDTTTLFQAASISKPIAALGILKLMEEGKVDLDSNVNNYLTDWKVPENKFTVKEKVTLRRLLSHRAGITVHGFPGYTKKDSFPTTKQVLLGEGNTSVIEVDTIPGSEWKYSGGGYTIVQKIIEDLTGGSFEEYMDNEILKPLGMDQSTYAQPLPTERHKQASAAYDNEGVINESTWHNYPEKGRDQSKRPG